MAWHCGPIPPRSFSERGSPWGLCVFAQSCVKKYIKAPLPEYDLPTFYNNILKLPANREGEQSTMGHTATVQGSWASDWALCLQCPCTFHPTSLCSHPSPQAAAQASGDAGETWLALSTHQFSTARGQVPGTQSAVSQCFCAPSVQTVSSRYITPHHR